MSLAARLRALVDAAPSDATVPVRWIADVLSAETDAGDGTSADDLTVEAIATRLQRAPSTVRSWCASGRIPGAYRLRRREWRIPPAGLEAFFEAERRGEGPAKVLPIARRQSDLSSWRHVRRA